MKKQLLSAGFVMLIQVLFALNSQAQRSNCGVSPEPNTIIQPDGSRITLRALGNEAVHYLETGDGYTVLNNGKGYYEYAALDAYGNLVLSGVVAKDGDKNKAGVPHLRYSEEQVNMLMQMHEQMTPPVEMGKAANPKPFPPKGKRKLLVILVEYPDLRATLPKENFELLLNQKDYNGTGSFKDYYLQTSHGQLDIESTVFGWVMADSSYKYYGKSSPSYSMATRQLLLGALKDANDSFNIDFSIFDNDSDGFVDGVILMHAGIGAEEQSAPNANDYIWSFRSTLSSSQRPTYDGVQVAAYAMFPEKRYNSGSMSMVGIGVMSHEFGHLLDLPDLYATQYGNEGCGNYSLMSGGPWLNNERTPSSNDAWSRIRMGWVTPIVISNPGVYKLPYSVADSDMVFRINTSRANEYYLLENRQKKGFDAFLPSKGLAIWHINTDKAKLLSESGSNNVNNDTALLGVGIMQADGLRNLEMNQNRGDGTDLYPLNNNRNFAPSTKPASNLQYKLGGVRQPSNVAITDITQEADSSITFELGLNASAAFAGNRSSGCAPLNVVFTSNTVGADSFSWDFANGMVASVANPGSRIFSRTGVYPVKLTTFKQGARVDSSTQLITVLETPEIAYSYERDDNYNVKFTNTSIYANSYAWVFSTKDTSLKSSDVSPVLQLSGPLKMFVKLTATSKDGCVKFSQDSVQIFAVGLTNNQLVSQLQLNAWPNPFQSDLVVSFNLNESGPVKMALYDVTGAQVAQADLGHMGSGQATFNLQTDVLSSGVYFLKLHAPAGDAWVKVIKQ